MTPVPDATDEAIVESALDLVDDAALELIDDSRAPPLGADEEIHGGTGLLAAQAACPAWAFYRYRLGATVLPALTFRPRRAGARLAAACRARAFWVGRGLAELLAMDDGLRATG
jgi:exodeoxyribonuclease-5